MDPTRCPHCKRKMKVATATDGRTDFKCLKCDQAEPFQSDASNLATGPMGEEAA